MLIREAFLRGISRRAVGRVVALLTEEVVSASTVSKLTRDLDDAVKQFHQARLSDDYAYLFLDRVSLRVRRRGGAQAGADAGGLRGAARRHVSPAGLSAPSGQESGRLGRAAGHLYRRGLEGRQVGTDRQRWLSRLSGGGDSHFQRFNLEWKTRTLSLFTQAA